MVIRYGAAIVVFLCAFAFGTLAAYAQLGFGETLTISVTPRFPVPGETVRVRAESLLMDLDNVQLTWYVNGVRSSEGEDPRESAVKAGSLVSETRVRVVLSEQGVEFGSAETVLRPTELDLLWEADSYVPSSYVGRALPSAGTMLRLEALPRFKRANGSLVLPGDITFTWRRNGYVVANVSGRGKYRVGLPSPPLFGTDTISVEARSSDGTFSGEASVQVPSTEPVLDLYEDHPIFGAQFHRALGAQNTLSEVEASFVAIPYFADASGRNDGSLVYEWRVDGNAVAGNPSRPGEIIINAEGSTGLARIDLTLSHVSNLFLSASGSWGMTFFPDTQSTSFGSDQ